jgi:hypothetical protein
MMTTDHSRYQQTQADLGRALIGLARSSPGNESRFLAKAAASALKRAIARCPNAPKNNKPQEAKR